LEKNLKTPGAVTTHCIPVFILPACRAKIENPFTK
jgi:hypothetical protein